MRKTTKPTGKKPVQTPTPPPEWKYAPELASWWYRGRGIGLDLPPNEFQLLAVGDQRFAGPVIATITISPAIDEEAAKRIMRLISHAPHLWRSLQDVAPSALGPDGPNEMFREAMDCLWQAAGRFPFVWPHADSDEAKLIQLHTDAITKQLEGGAA